MISAKASRIFKTHNARGVGRKAKIQKIETISTLRRQGLTNRAIADRAKVIINYDIKESDRKYE